MKKVNSGIGDNSYYQKYYTSRDWTAYKGSIQEVIRYSKPGEILDVGSGVGFFLEACQAWGLSCFGIEGSADGIMAMKNRNPTLEACQHYLSEPFPFENNFFQTIIINQVIEHLESEVQLNCIRECYRVMREGGALIVHSPSRFNRKERKADPTHINLLSPSDLSKILINEGFHSLVDLNYLPLYILGSNLMGRTLINLIYKTLKPERLSADSSFVAYK